MTGPDPLGRAVGVTLPGLRWFARWATWALIVPDDGGSLEFAVSEGDPDGADVGADFEPVRSEAVGEGTE